jgi:Na+-driven multidrug efflux pump
MAISFSLASTAILSYLSGWRKWAHKHEFRRAPPTTGAFPFSANRARQGRRKVLAAITSATPIIAALTIIATAFTRASSATSVVIGREYIAKPQHGDKFIPFG